VYRRQTKKARPRRGMARREEIMDKKGIGEY
jgi:hypothetical protein